MTGNQAYALSRKYTEESLKGAGALVGKSPYEVAVDNGYTGTEQEWLDSLKGSPESLLSDDAVSEESTWSSAKISEELKKLSESGAGAVSYHLKSRNQLYIC